MLVLPPAAHAASGERGTESGEGITLNFEQADIRSVIALVSEHTGRNFIVDPRVRGEMTIISHRPVDSQQLYQVFLSALQVHGFSAIPADGAVRIVPKSLARRDHTPVTDDAAPGEGYDFVTRVLTVEHAEAAELVPLLRPLLSDEAQLAAYPPTNTLILSEAAGNIERIRQVIAQLDRETTGVTEIVPLRYASAREVVSLVGEIEPQERAGRRLLLAADERSNSVLLGGDPRRRPAVRSLIQRLDEQLKEEEGVAVIYLRYTDADSIRPILEDLAEGLMHGDESQPRVSIQAHESTNALIINGPPDTVGQLRTVINRLDVRRAQVLVEAIIAEVSADRAQQLGIQWGALGDQAVGLVNFGAAGAGSVRNIAGSIEGGSVPDVDGLSAAVSDRRGEFAMLLRALTSESDTNILSTPSVLTMDNEEAEIVVGENVPFITGRAIEESGQAFSAIQRQDVGVKLRVRPQINEGDALKLELEKEVSAVAGRPEGAEDLVTSMRSIVTTAMVDDGQIIVLGGLIDEKATTQTQRVPGLGSLPGLGRLFRYERSQTEKQNLMVFLRPQIVVNREDARAVTSPKYTLLRNQQLAMRERGLRFIDDDEIPLLDDARAELMALPPSFEDRVGRPGSDRQRERLGAPPRAAELFN
ncbi:type II secretion system protein GspD [Halorhodospira abdelmalekii]|nr:secretin N-terminal domain-containing protein [Halorhodospira abdelmalekii]MBK1733771.1 type II secretion system protein GspD [Halorhodospira abdelmalekii]